MTPITTRFPPSPSGFLHVGGARTALFNWLYARHTGGRFILRIEDTDTARSTQKSVDAILEALEWLGIDWDEGPFFQSQRIDIYNECIQKLIASQHAYYCTCTPEAIEAMRAKALASGGKPKYDGTCREKGLGPQPGAVVRFATPLEGTTIVRDAVKGDIVFQNSELDDFVIQRSNGMPIYNLAVVADDISMRINTIIRGDDHVNNTPKQILLYQALGVPLPLFAHVPMVLGHDRTRLSKRHGAMSVTAYRDMGFLPDAVINYLVRLGWSYGDQEIFSRAELIEKFNIDNIGRSAGVFDLGKLTALNAEHIKVCPPAALTAHLLPFLIHEGYSAEPGDYLNQVIQTLRDRSKTLVEMTERARFYYQEISEYDPKGASKFFTRAIIAPMAELTRALAQTGDFSEKNLEAIFTRVMDSAGLALGKIAQPVRLALTGKTFSPGIFEIITILGREKTVQRLEKALSFMNGMPRVTG